MDQRPNMDIHSDSDSDGGETIKGVVSDVKESLLYFEVDGEKRIYVDITKDSPTFPSKGELVEISNLSKFTYCPMYTGVMGPQTIYRFRSNNIQTRQLFWAMKRSCISNPEELLAMDKIIRRLRMQIGENSLLKCLLTLLANTSVCEKKKSFKKVKVIFSDDFNHNKETPASYPFIVYDGLCSVHVQPSQSLERPYSNGEFLIGILDVEENTGFFTLDKSMVVQFKPYDGDMRKFRNTLVLIKKWIAFDEVFQLENVPVLKYILADFKDISIITPLKKNSTETEIFKTEAKFQAMLQINRISDVIFGYHRQPEIWIAGFTLDSVLTGKQGDSVYLCYPNVSVAPFLKEKAIYKLTYNVKPVREYRNPQLYALKDGRLTYILDKTTIFREATDVPLENDGYDDIVIDTITDVMEFMSVAPDHQLFSVTLKISKKVLQRISYQSYYPKRFNKLLRFGNVDEKHQMQVTFFDSEEQIYLDIFLTNRDNHVTAMGLVEGMLVTISHVQHIKGRYLKTSPLSSIRILDYVRGAEFCSVTLPSTISSRIWKWADTPATPLGRYASLPFHCIVMGSFVLHAVFDLLITPVCLYCQRPVVEGKPCLVCTTTARDLRVNMRIYVQDPRMVCFKIDVGRDYFYKLMGLRNHQERQCFANAFFKCSAVNVNLCKIQNFNADSFTTDLESQEFLVDILDTIYRHINFKLFTCADGVCIRNKGESAHWRLLQFELIYNGNAQ